MLNNFFNKKIVLGLLILSILLPSVIFYNPQKVEAQVAVIEANSTPNLFQSIISAGSSVISSASTYSLQFKEYIGDGLAILIVKQIIRQITSSVVTWINSGFEGSPAFLQNPGSFFLDVADQITGDFLAKKGGALADLCSPFSIDIRLALAFKYRPNIPKRYECTLSKIIQNTKNAVAGASINGFTAGDFKQGGWPAFVSLTTEPQNNAYGAYLTAESELSIRVANAKIEKKDELGAGKGFLSWRDPKCKAEVKANNEKIAKNFDQLYDGVDGETYSQTSARIGGDVTQSTLRSANDCPVQTPGTVIEGQLQNSLGGPLRELELADEINEVVNALFAQLVTQVLQKGLGAVSGSGPGDSSSYITSIQNEAAAANGQNVDELRASLLKNMDVYIQNTTQYKANKDASLNTVLATKAKYEAGKACYASKIASTNPKLRESDAAEAQNKINTIESIIITKVAPIAAKQLTAAEEADSRLRILNDIKTSAIAAKTVNDLNIPSQKYGLLVQEQRLTNSKDIVDSQQELTGVQSQTQDLNAEALRISQACDLFPTVRR